MLPSSINLEGNLVLSEFTDSVQIFDQYIYIFKNKLWMKS